MICVVLQVLTDKLGGLVGVVAGVVVRAILEFFSVCLSNVKTNMLILPFLYSTSLGLVCAHSF